MRGLSERCSDIVREYDSQGWHRSATEIDHQSGEWLIARLREAGVPATAEGFPFSRVDAEPATIRVGDTVIPGVPLSDSLLPLRGRPLEGKLVARAPGPGDIALVHLDRHDRGDELRMLRSNGAQAIVVAVEGFPSATTVMNAWNYERPFGPPVIQVPEEAWSTLEEAERQAAIAKLNVVARRTKTSARNVVGSVPGHEATLAPLVVLTPRSGWWYCAGERGGGIAILVEVARRIASDPLQRRVVFLATTGHELGFVGAKRYLDKHPGLASGAEFWVHLGANIGASESHLVVRSANEDLLAHARGAAFPAARYALTDAPVGEAGVVHAHGGRFISLVGADFPRFHSTADRWPDAIDPDAIAENVEAVIRLLRRADVEFSTDGPVKS